MAATFTHPMFGKVGPKLVDGVEQFLGLKYASIKNRLSPLKLYKKDIEEAVLELSLAFVPVLLKYFARNLLWRICLRILQRAPLSEPTDPAQLICEVQRRWSPTTLNYSVAHNPTARTPHSKPTISPESRSLRTKYC